MVPFKRISPGSSTQNAVALGSGPGLTCRLGAGLTCRLGAGLIFRLGTGVGAKEGVNNTVGLCDKVENRLTEVA